MDLQQLLDVLNHQTRKVNDLRADNEQMNVVILKWIEANNAAATLINEQQAEIERLSAKVRQLEHDLHPPCNCPHCTGLPDYYADEAALDAAGEE